MKTKPKLLLLFLLGTFVFFGLSAQIPYVYTSENTGSGYSLPPLPARASCPYVYFLPDPYKFSDGTSSSALSDWEHHRNDFRAMLENYEIGTKPLVDKASQVTATYSGNTLTVKVTVGSNTLTLTCAISIPSGATAPYPICIGMNSSYGSMTASEFTSRGIVGITFSHDQVTTYNSPSNSDPFFKLYPSQNIDNTGQYAAWIWGVSRIIDGLEKVKAAGTFNVDLNHIAVSGCSYAGKMALFSGAFDERVALTIAQESGGGGATSWRYSKTRPDGTVEGLAQTSDQWFKNSAKTDFGGDNVWYLPDDHHMLMAMCAPRALFATGNTDYEWLSNMSFYVCNMACAKIYNDLGVSDRFGFVLDGGHSHCAVPTSQNTQLGYFLNKFMKDQTSLSQTYRVHPTAYDTINYTRWYSNWGGSTNVPVTGVSLNQTTATVNAGTTAQLTATVAPANATNKSVMWNSSNTAIATVSATGVVTGVAAGSATITVTTVDGAKTATCALTVNNVNVPVTGVSVNPTTASIAVGGTSQLTATIVPTNASNKNVTWSSSNTTIATVSSTGVVTGVATGSATITVTTADGPFTATCTITVTQPTSSVSINCGGSVTGSFTADQYYSGGTAYTNTATIDLSQIISNPPPAAVFNTERYGAMTYTIPVGAAGSTQTVTLYFAENYVTAAGQRVFNVSINGTSVLSNFDIYSVAGGQNKAIARSFSATANSSGQMVIQFTAVTQNPKINGITVTTSGSNPTLSISTTSMSVAAAASSTGTFSVTSNTSWTVSSNQTWLSVNPASGSNNGTVTVTAQQNTGSTTRSATVTVAATGATSQTVTVTQAAATVAAININCGGSATGTFTADQYYSGGSTYTNTATISMSLITTNPPPAAIFNSERYGAMTYTIPAGTAGSAQTVTLYFAETYVNANGQRVFNVSINGTSVLSNFDIYKTAVGQNKAIAQTFNTTANSSGQVVIQFTAVTQNPKINGISVTAGSSKSASAPEEYLESISKVIYFYPNPVSEKLNVVLTGSPAVISLYSNGGQLLMKMNTVNTAEAIDMSKYAPGMYILKITSADQIIVEKVIKR